MPVPSLPFDAPAVDKPAVPEDAAENAPAPSPATVHIHSLLSCPVDVVPDFAMNELISLQVRPLPSEMADPTRSALGNASSSSTSPAPNHSHANSSSIFAIPPRTCCFDAVNASWSVHRICPRCDAINSIHNVRNSNTALIQALLATAHYTTDCCSTPKRTGVTPPLPLEVLQMIIDCAIHDCSTTKDGSVLCALMHTSCLIRSKIVRAFEPLQLFEVNRPPINEIGSIVEFHFPRQVSMHVWDMLEYLICDFSTRKHVKTRPPLPPNFNLVGAQGRHAIEAKISVTVSADAFELGDREITETLVTGKQQVIYSPEARRHVDGSDVYRKFNAAIDELLFRMPRVAHPFTRAMQGTLARPSQGFKIYFVMILYKASDVCPSSFCKIMQFDTQPFEA